MFYKLVTLQKGIFTTVPAINRKKQLNEHICSCNSEWVWGCCKELWLTGKLLWEENWDIFQMGLQQFQLWICQLIKGVCALWQLLNKDLKMCVGLTTQKSCWASVSYTETCIWWVETWIFFLMKLDLKCCFSSVLPQKLENILCCFGWCQIEQRDVVSADQLNGDVALKDFLWLVQFLQ